MHEVLGREQQQGLRAKGAVWELCPSSLLLSKHPSTTSWCSLLGSCSSKSGQCHLQWQHSHHQAELSPMGRGATQPGRPCRCHNSTLVSLPELWARVPPGAGPLLTHQPRQPRLAHAVEEETHLEHVAQPQARAQRESRVSHSAHSPGRPVPALRRIFPAAPWRAEQNSLCLCRSRKDLTEIPPDLSRWLSCRYLWSQWDRSTALLHRHSLRSLTGRQSPRKAPSPPLSPKGCSGWTLHSPIPAPWAAFLAGTSTKPIVPPPFHEGFNFQGY